tara:strand:- start:69 stop:341 length:273 start_codon:yes stop_codon:yes gene_type:complete
MAIFGLSIPAFIGLSTATTGASSVVMGYGYTSGAYLGYGSWNTSDPLGVQASKRRYISPKSHISVPYGYRRRYYRRYRPYRRFRRYRRYY